tara:strand:+ start:5801 stop:7372 length:1572 start_codon:yes stop_codon:yes gene_type:complete
MSRLLNATIVDDEDLFASIQGEEKTITFEYKINTPFTVKEHTPEHDDDDVVVYGPVYVGDEKMLDRHKELVSPEAIMDSWDSYSKNPVILYNHRKDYGVIGRMETVEMGSYEKPDGQKIQAVFGRAIIDGGEENITRKIRKGMLKAFSIGFIAKAAIKEGRGDNAYLKFTNIEWIETSVVDIPASPNALFNVSKSVVEYDGAKHIIAVEEREGSYVIEFGKSEDTPDIPSSPEEGTEMQHEVDEIIELLDTIAGLEAKMAELESRLPEPIGGDTVKTHEDSQPTMTEAELAEEVEEVVEETPVELSAPEETFTMKSEDHIKSEEVEEEVLEEEATEEEEAEEAEEEVVEEEAVEEEAVEEVLEEELVEEVAEATEEESAEVPVETKEESEDVEGAVLSEVVIALSAVETGLSNLIARLDETESLKALLAEKDAEIATLSETIDANAKQAEFDAAVDAKVAEKLAEQGATPANASPKSLSPAKPHGDILTDVTSHDKGANPQVSKGMAHLGAWLEGRLGGRRTE